MKVSVFGCQQIAIEFIKFLQDQPNIEIGTVFTYELSLDATYGYQSVLSYCDSEDLPCVNVKTINEDHIKILENEKPDIIFSVYFRKVFSKKILNLPKLGCVNIHPSKLPFYRGPTPTAWMILNGEKEFGITIHKMDSGIDTGDILIQKTFEIGHRETGFELYSRAMSLGADLLKQEFAAIVNEKIIPKPQVGMGSYYGKTRPKAVIDWRASSEKIVNLIRVHAPPFNPAETQLFNRYVFITEASVVNNIDKPLQGGGRIVEVIGDTEIIVSCSDGYIKLEKFDFFPPLNSDDRLIYLKSGNRFD